MFKYTLLTHVATGLEYLHGLGIIHGGAPPLTELLVCVATCGLCGLSESASAVLRPQT